MRLTLQLLPLPVCFVMMTTTIMMMMAAVVTVTGFVVVVPATGDNAGRYCRCLFRRRRDYFPVLLFMGKGFSRAGNRRADLAKKMELAKKQKDIEKLEDDGTVTADVGENAVSGAKSSSKQQQQQDPDDDEEHQHQLFAELLAERGPIRQDPSEDTFASSEQTKQAIRERKSPAARREDTIAVRGMKYRKERRKKKSDKKKKKKDDDTDDEANAVTTVLKQGDVANRRSFEMLLDEEGQQPLGPIRAAQLVPWVPPYLSQFLIVVADPRKQSSELVTTLNYLKGGTLDPKILSQVVAVTSDPATAAAASARRNDDDDTTSPAIKILVDNSKLEWMRMYSVIVDDERWSMSLLIFNTDGRIVKLQRQMNPSHASRCIMEAIEQIN